MCARGMRKENGEGIQRATGWMKGRQARRQCARERVKDAKQRDGGNVERYGEMERTVEWRRNDLITLSEYKRN